jgi:serine/threonine protein kinase
MYFDKKEMKFKNLQDREKDFTNEKIVEEKVENGGEQNTENNFDENSENGMQKNNSNMLFDLLHRENLVGTAEYASPEMLNNTVINHLTTDIWSLGCIIYKFFHGRTPFKGNNDLIVFDNILNMRFTISKDLPEIVQDLLTRLLVENPEKRLGAGIKGGDFDFQSLKSHDFFRGINFNSLGEQTPPIKINSLTKFKSSDDFSPLICLKDNNSEISDFNISTNNIMSGNTYNSPIVPVKKLTSSFFVHQLSISEFSFESYSEHEIIDDYVVKIDDMNLKSPTKGKDLHLVYEGVLKKQAFFLVYSTRRIKLFSNGKVDIYDVERNALLV